MARARGSSQPVTAPPRKGKRPVEDAKRRLGTSEARASLPNLVKELAAMTEPSDSLADNAIEIGPHRKGGVWLVPEADARAAAAAQDEIENLAVAFMLDERLEQSSGVTSGRDFLRELGHEDLLEGLPGGERG